MLSGPQRSLEDCTGCMRDVRAVGSKRFQRWSLRWRGQVGHPLPGGALREANCEHHGGVSKKGAAGI